MEIISHSAGQTLYIGKSIAKRLEPADIICLFGQLGAGKTVLTKGIAEGLGIGREEVISPSFVLLRQYRQGRLPLYHFDLYRTEGDEDILSIGYEEYFYGDGVSVIEWAEKLGHLLPAEFIKIELLVKGDKERRLKFSAFGKRCRALLEQVREDIRH